MNEDTSPELTTVEQQARTLDIGRINIQAIDGLVHISIRNADITDEIIWFSADLTPDQADSIADSISQSAHSMRSNPASWGFVEVFTVE